MPCVRSKRLSFSPCIKPKCPWSLASLLLGVLWDVFHHERDETGAGDVECTLSSSAGSAHQTSPMSVATVLSKGLEKRGCPHLPNSQAHFQLITCFSSLVKPSLNYPSEATVA